MNMNYGLLSSEGYRKGMYEIRSLREHEMSAIKACLNTFR